MNIFGKALKPQAINTWGGNTLFHHLCPRLKGNMFRLLLSAMFCVLDVNMRSRLRVIYWKEHDHSAG